NENGIVELGEKAVSMPIFDKDKADKWWFRFINKGKDGINFNQWFAHFSLAYGFKIAVPVAAHYLFSIFRDIAVDQIGYSPILFLKGPAGTGKGTIARLMLA